MIYTYHVFPNSADNYPLDDAYHKPINMSYALETLNNVMNFMLKDTILYLYINRDTDRNKNKYFVKTCNDHRYMAVNILSIAL